MSIEEKALFQRKPAYREDEILHMWTGSIEPITFVRQPDKPFLPQQAIAVEKWKYMEAAYQAGTLKKETHKSVEGDKPINIEMDESSKKFRLAKTNWISLIRHNELAEWLNKENPPEYKKLLNVLLYLTENSTIESIEELTCILEGESKSEVLSGKERTCTLNTIGALLYIAWKQKQLLDKCVQRNLGLQQELNDLWRVTPATEALIDELEKIPWKPFIDAISNIFQTHSGKMITGLTGSNLEKLFPRARDTIKGRIGGSKIGKSRRETKKKL